jgi:archaellum biogenesis protein FlaJ (TadC family)
MENIQMDWLVIVIAAVVNMVIGFFWYSKWLFGPLWHKLAHESEKKKRDNTAQIYWFITSLVMAFFLAFFEGYLGVTTVSDGMFVGFCIWLGFVATTQISCVIWSGRPLQLFFVNTGGKLLSYLVMSGIIGA